MLAHHKWRVGGFLLEEHLHGLLEFSMDTLGSSICWVAWQSEIHPEDVFFSKMGIFNPKIGTFRLEIFQPKRQFFASFVELGQEQKPDLTHFPTLHEAGVPRNTKCLVSPHHCFCSVGAWLIAKKMVSLGKTLGLILVMLLDQMQYMYFCLQKLWQILLAPRKISSNKSLHQPICKKPQSELVWCTEASTMPSLMRVTMMRFVSPEGEWEGHLCLIFCKQSQDARHDGDSLKWNDDSISFGSLGR